MYFVFFTRSIQFFDYGVKFHSFHSKSGNYEVYEVS